MWSLDIYNDKALNCFKIIANVVLNKFFTKINKENLVLNKVFTKIERFLSLNVTLNKVFLKKKGYYFFL